MCLEFPESNDRLLEVVVAVRDLQKQQEETSKLLAYLISKVDGVEPVTQPTPYPEHIPTRGSGSDILKSCALRLEMGEEGLSKALSQSVLPNARENSGDSKEKVAPGNSIYRLVQEVRNISESVSPELTNKWKWMQYWADRLVSWRQFEYVMGLVILTNSICIGVETEVALHSETPQELVVLEDVFMVIYLLELALRIVAKGRRVFYNSWFIFDFALVLTGVVGQWIYRPLTENTDSNSILSQLMVIRTCRLLRLLRALRMVQQFRSIWRLVYGLLTSFNTMVSTLSLVGLVLYIFACLGVELITRDADLNNPDSGVQDIIDTNFSNLFITMLFLLQFVTLDSVAGVYMPLVKKKPGLIAYFLSIILVVAISLMNLVMAKIVEGALEAAHTDKEVEREQRREFVKSLIPKLHDLFHSLDSDESGMVNLRELESIQVSQLPDDLAIILKMDSMKELFEILDVDSSGEVTKEEFVEGILHLHLADMPVHQMQLLKLTRVLRNKVGVLDDRVHILYDSVAEMQRERLSFLERVRHPRL